MTEAALVAGQRCAVHPDVPARDAPCDRCGAFACEACFGAQLDEDGLASLPDTERERLCQACRERTGRGEVPWEDPRLPVTSRLGRTLQRALAAPVATFEAIGEGDLGRAASFAIVTTAVGYGPFLALIGLGFVILAAFGMPGFAPIGSGNAGAWGVGLLLGLGAILPIFVVAFSLFSDLYVAVVFHVAALLLGGKGTFEGSLRGALYTSAVRTVLAPLVIFMFVPLLGPIFNLAVRVGMLVWCGFALSGTARGVHRLDGNKAAVAGAAAPLSLALLFIALIVVAFGLGLAAALGGRF